WPPPCGSRTTCRKSRPDPPPRRTRVTGRGRTINDLSPADATSSPRTCLQLEWEAAKRPHLFPFMRAELAIYPLTASETQLDFSGCYEPPLGGVGRALGSIVGHRGAGGAVHGLVRDVAASLRTTIGPASAR